MATPWDDCPYGKSNANTFVRARAHRVFPDLVCRDQPRGHPSGLVAPSGGPSVDPSTLGQKTLYELACLKYCYNPLCRFVKGVEKGRRVGRRRSGENEGAAQEVGRGFARAEETRGSVQEQGARDSMGQPRMPAKLSLKYPGLWSILDTVSPGLTRHYQQQFIKKSGKSGKQGVQIIPARCTAAHDFVGLPQQVVSSASGGLP